MQTPRRNIKFLTREEVTKIIDTCGESARERRDRALLEVLFSTGLRISEALALERAVFEPWRQGETIKLKTYQRELVLPTKEIKTVELSVVGKGGWQRVVYFSPQAIRAVGLYLEKRRGKKIGDKLFPITARAAQLMVKRRAKMANIDKFVSPHVFRHSLATDLLRQGVDIRFVSEFLGHRSLNNTMIYTHVVSSQLRKIHEKLYARE